MSVENGRSASCWISRLLCFLLVCLFPALGFSVISAQTPAPGQTNASGNSLIPAGTILPVALRTTIAAEKVKQGQIINGEIAQDVSLPDGSKIRKGSKVEGRIVEVTAAASSHGARVSIRFDKLHSGGQVIPLTTDLRAIAGFMTVLEAGLPDQGLGEGDVAAWATTTQIGGDSVFGAGGPVTSAHNATDVIGKSPASGGVLVQPTASETARCRGQMDNNTSPQALWVFSADACGTYGLSNINIAHAGRTDPVGTFTLDFQGHKTKVDSGAGLLLRVIS